MRHVPRSFTPLLFGALFLAACGGGGGGGSNGGPVGPPADGNPYDGTGVVGAAGGSVSLGDGASIDIPAGALSGDVTITIQKVATPADLQADGAIGQAYRFSPIDLVLSSPARIYVFVKQSDLGGRPFSSVSIRRSTTTTGALAPAGEELGGIRNDAGGIVSGTTTQLGVFSAVATTPPNRNPTANAGPDASGTVGTSVGLSGSGSDPDGDALTFQWTFSSRPTGSGASIQNATSASAAFVPDLPGTYVLRLAVDDGHGGTASDTVTITVTQAGGGGSHAPVADAGSDQSVSAGSQVTLDGSGSSDPDQGDVLTYSWRLLSGPSSVSIQSATSARARATLSSSGEYVFELTVSDGTFSARDTVKFTVIQPNRAPSVSLAVPGFVYPGTTVHADANASDPDGDALSFQWALLQRPGGSTATIADNGTSASFTPDLVGSYLLRVTVSDGSQSVTSDATVWANRMVAGSYPSTFTATSVSGNCLDFVHQGDTAQDDLVVAQPSPDRVTLKLSNFPNFQSDATGQLRGDQFHFSGTVKLGNDQGNVDANGTFDGPFTDTGFSLSFDFNALSVCFVSGTMTSP